MLLTWVAVGVLTFELNLINVKTKKALFPIFIILLASTVVLLMAKYLSGWQLYIVGYPPILFIAIWAIWHNRFCQGCGKSNVNLMSFYRALKCKKCGKLMK